jgi:hypothetical protein
MVKRTTPHGTTYHEPPYTPEEERDFYRRIAGGPITVVKSTRDQRRKPPMPLLKPERK